MAVKHQNGLLSKTARILRAPFRKVPFIIQDVSSNEEERPWLERLTKFHLVPGSPFLSLWEDLLVLMGCINGFIIPFSVAFNDFTPAILSIQYLLDVLYLFDIYVRFHIAYVERGFIVIFPKEMALRYLNSKEFLFDVVSNFPWDIFALVGTGIPEIEALYLLGIIRLVKLLRTLKLAWWFNTQEKRLNSSTGIQIVKFAIYISLVQHWAACLWYVIACPQTICSGQSWVTTAGVELASKSEQYVASLYWSVMSMTTTGYGEVHAVSEGEQVFSIIAMITGVFLFGYVSGTIASILSNLDSRRVAYRQKVEAIRQYMSDQQMEKLVQKRVTDWYEYSWDRNRGIDVANVFNDLPVAFRAEVALTLNKQAIEKTPIFDGTSLGFKRTLAVCMGVNYFTADTCIVHKNEMSKEMYFVIQGRIDILNDQETKPLHSLIEGSHFGEFSLILGHLADATIIAVSNCDVYVLTNESFMYARESYPEDFEIVRANTERQYEKWRLQQESKSRRKAVLADDDFDSDSRDDDDEPGLGPGSAGHNGIQVGGKNSTESSRSHPMHASSGALPAASRRGSLVNAGFVQATKEDIKHSQNSMKRRQSTGNRSSYETKLPQMPERKT